jgi:hypothetical protein
MADVGVEGKRKLTAFGSIKFAAGAIVAATTFNNGAVAVRTGLGVTTLTLTESLNAASCQVLITRRDAGTGFPPTVVDTSDTVKTVNTFDATAGGAGAADRNFDYEVWAVNPG